ncbi:CheR family methyltransferase [Desulfonema magnum]|nr:CheR family methyltransferase [Desulfonema magnum]
MSQTSIAKAECDMKNSNSDNSVSRLNSEIVNPNPQFQSMPDKIFFRFSAFIHNELGIKMPEVKKTMLQARLQKRLRKLGITTFEEYYDYVFSPRGIEKELPNMIDVVTTNKTDFFREPQHFDYLTQTVLPWLIRRNRAFLKTDDDPVSALRKTAMIWSAGCSSGEEPYTLAMVLSDFAFRYPGFTYSILATDISTKVLKKAILGIYDHERVEPVPLRFRKRYLLKSKDKTKDIVRIVPELRAAVKFRRLNLMEKSLCIRETMDIIFFRNVLIYFDRTTQESVLNRLCYHLRPEGFMFMGHSETLNSLDVPLIPVATAVYRKIG